MLESSAKTPDCGAPRLNSPGLGVSDFTDIGRPVRTLTVQRGDGTVRPSVSNESLS